VIFRAQAPLSPAVQRAVAARDPGLAETLASRERRARRRGWFW
jgi:hypothetical protein